MVAATESDLTPNDLISFTLDQVLGLTGITRRQLVYWIDTDVIRPQVEAKGQRGKIRLFSFTDLLEVRVASWLRNIVSLQFIRRIVLRLREEESMSGPLSSVGFRVFEHRESTLGKVHYRLVMQRRDGSWEDPDRAGQLIFELTLPVADLRRELVTSIELRRQRTDRVGKVERRRGVMGSTPVVAGTRIPTAAIWRLHKSGRDIDGILDSYPGLQREDIQAALEAEGQRRRKPA